MTRVNNTRDLTLRSFGITKVFPYWTLALKPELIPVFGQSTHR